VPKYQSARVPKFKAGSLQLEASGFYFQLFEIIIKGVFDCLIDV